MLDNMTPTTDAYTALWDAFNNLWVSHQRLAGYVASLRADVKAADERAARANETAAAKTLEVQRLRGICNEARMFVVDDIRTFLAAGIDVTDEYRRLTETLQSAAREHTHEAV